MIEHELGQRVDRFFDDDTQADWVDVLQRHADAGNHVRPRRRRLVFGWRSRVAPPGTRPLVVAGLVGAAITAVPALAFSTPLRNLVGMKSLPRPALAATLTGAPARDSRPKRGSLVTVTFTVGKPGKAPGAGVGAGSAFAVNVVRESGTPQRRLLLTEAHGANGRYRAQIRWPGGRIESIQIAGWLNVPPSEVPTAEGGVWLDIPIVNDPYPY